MVGGALDDPALWIDVALFLAAATFITVRRVARRVRQQRTGADEEEALRAATARYPGPPRDIPRPPPDYRPSGPPLRVSSFAWLSHGRLGPVVGPIVGVLLFVAILVLGMALLSLLVAR